MQLLKDAAFAIRIAVADPDFQVTGGGHPDPEIRGGGAAPPGPSPRSATG